MLILSAFFPVVIQVPNYGCPYNTTTTPVYDSTKLQSYLIGAHTRGPEGEHVSDVATELAKSVTELYPTLTLSFSDLANVSIVARSCCKRDQISCGWGEVNVERGVCTSALRIMPHVLFPLQRSLCFATPAS